MKTLLFLICLLVVIFCARAQTGFFLIADDRDCGHKVTALDRKQYCITDKPIIEKSEFKAEGNLQREIPSQKQYFNLRFSKAGFEKLKVICEQLPEKTLIFVVNGQAVGAFEHMQPKQVIQIIDTPDSQEIEKVLNALKKENGG
jgi:hypothetical protein